MDRAEYQLIQTLFGLGLGISLGLFYDIYRAWLRQGKNKNARTIGDVLWWGFALLWTFFWLLMLNWAELRFMIFFMIGIGLLLYIFCLSRFLLPIFFRLWQLIFGIFSLIWQALCQACYFVFAPIVWLSGIVYEFGRVIIKVLAKIFTLLAAPFGIVGRAGKKVSGKVKTKGRGLIGKIKAKKQDNSDVEPEDIAE